MILFRNNFHSGWRKEDFHPTKAQSLQRKKPASFFCAFGALVVQLVCIACLTLTVPPVFGQNEVADRLQVALVKNGFENVAVLLEGRQLIVTYENRIYRDESRAAQEVLALLVPMLPAQITLTLIPQNRRLPLAAITLAPGDYPASANGEASRRLYFARAQVTLEVEPYWGKVRGLPRANSSGGKLDLVVHPQFHAHFGERTDPVESQINVAPAIAVSLWPGMALSAQGIIPLQNDLEQEGDHWRPGLLTLNQTVRLPKTMLAGLTVGYFTSNRYGADLAAKKYFRNGRAAAGANLGYTGFASYYKGTWRYSSVNMLTALLHADYRLAPFDLTLRATAGQFLQKERGWRVEVQRQFREVDIGFYVMNTELGTNGGFNFSVPIFPPKHWRAGALRVRTANYFPWEYQYKRFDNPIFYDSGNSLNQFHQRLHPDHLNNHY